VTTTPLVLVDVRNVLRSVWPNLGEEEAARLACEWARERGCRALVVFDGRPPDVVTAEGCTVVGSGDESADDTLVREAEALAGSGDPYWLVTSDRALRAAAGSRAARTIGGGTFARELRALR
jgi:hypothetical protein